MKGNEKVKREITSLLDKVKVSFPDRFKETAKLLEEGGMDRKTIDSSFTEKISKAEPFEKGIPTLKARIYRRATPMLEARFNYAGTWSQSLTKWLGVKDMEKALKNKHIQSHIQSHREYWEGSAPALFPPERLSLYGIVEGQEENQTYLVWPEKEGAEPEVWVYSGHSEQKYKDLKHYLEWVLGNSA